MIMTWDRYRHAQIVVLLGGIFMLEIVKRAFKLEINFSL